VTLFVLFVGVIGHYFAECIHQLRSCPCFVRTDCGTENSILVAMQVSQRQDQRAHVFGTSTSNQRIEAWWAFLRRNRSQWWMDLFAYFVNDGIFHVGHPRETDCLRYCFMAILQQDLAEVVQYWNSHRIRPSRGSRCPAGVPDVLYCMPTRPSIDCGHPVRPLDANITALLTMPTVCEDPDFEAYLSYLCHFYNWQSPTTVDDAVTLYTQLQRII